MRYVILFIPFCRTSLFEITMKFIEISEAFYYNYLTSWMNDVSCRHPFLIGWVSNMVVRDWLVR